MSATFSVLMHKVFVYQVLSLFCDGMPIGNQWSMLRNMYLLKTRVPGLLPNVECVPACIVCIVIANALTMKSSVRAPVICCGGPCSSVLRTLPTI